MVTINDFCELISKWVNENNEDGKIVEFSGSFFVIDPEKDFEVVDDRVMAYGSKETLLIGLEELTKMVQGEEEEFINW